MERWRPPPRPRTVADKQTRGSFYILYPRLNHQYVLSSEGSSASLCSVGTAYALWPWNSHSWHACGAREKERSVRSVEAGRGGSAGEAGKSFSSGGLSRARKGRGGGEARDWTPLLRAVYSGAPPSW